MLNLVDQSGTHTRAHAFSHSLTAKSLIWLTDEDGSSSPLTEKKSFE